MQIQNYFSFQKQISAWILIASIVFAFQCAVDVTLFHLYECFLFIRATQSKFRFWSWTFSEPDNSKQVKLGHQGIREESELSSVMLRVHFYPEDLFSHCLMISQFHYLFHLVFVVTMVILLLADDVLI